MTKKEYCLTNEAKAYTMVLSWIIILLHGFEYGINDYAYISVNYDNGTKTSYHKLKVYYDDNDAYIMLKGSKYSMSEFIRVGL